MTRIAIATLDPITGKLAAEDLPDNVLIAITDRGAWAAGTQYHTHDLVTYGGTTWLVEIAHVSTSTFDDTKFTELGSYRGAWQANTRYETGDQVVNSGVLYSANSAFTSGSSFNPTNWTQLTQTGVSSFNTRTGGVTLSKADVTGTGLAASDIGAAQGLIPTAVKTSAYTAAASDFVPVDISAGSVTITLPNAPADKTRIGVKVIKVDGSHANTATVARAGTDVFNVAAGSTTLTLSALFQGVLLQYSSSAGIWYVSTADTPIGQPGGAGSLDATGRQPIAQSPLSVAIGASLFGTMEFYGHSLTYGGSSDQALRGSDGRITGMIRSGDRDRTHGGAILANHEASPWSTAGNGGWAHIYRYTEQDLNPGFSEATELGYEGTGAFEAKRDYAQLWYDINDLAKLGPSNLTPFTNALSAVISRLRAAAIFEDDDSSVTYTGAGWGSVAGATEPTKNQSGSTYHQTPTNGDSLSVAIPSSFPGGTAALAFIAGAGGQGALWTFTVDGASAGTLDTRNANAKDYVTNANGKATPAVARFTGLAAGAHTIVAIATTVNSEALFDCWWAEGRTSPLIVVPLAFRHSTYTVWAATPYTPVDADIATLNTAIQGVVNGFDADVLTVALDATINKNANYFVSDGAHLNDEGHALVAAQIVLAIAAQARTVAQHAAGNTSPAHLSRNPWHTLRNTIQAAQPDAVGLSVYGRSPGDQTAVLLDLLSQGASADAILALGRTADEASASVIGTAGDGVSGSAAGDFVARVFDTTKALRLGVGSTEQLRVTQNGAEIPAGIGTNYAPLPLQGASGSNGAIVANTLYLGAIQIPWKVTLTGVLVWCSTDAGNCLVSLYNAAGSTLLASSNSTATSTHNIPFTSAYVAAPGMYFIGVQYSSATAKGYFYYSPSRSGVIAQGAFTVPSTVSVPSVSTGNYLQGLVGTY